MDLEVEYTCPCRLPWAFDFRCWQKWVFNIDRFHNCSVICWGYTRAKHSTNQSFYSCIKNNQTADGQMFPEGSGWLFRQDFYIARYTVVHHMWVRFPASFLLLYSDVLPPIAHYTEALRDTLMICKDILKLFWAKGIILNPMNCLCLMIVK